MNRWASTLAVIPVWMLTASTRFGIATIRRILDDEPLVLAGVQRVQIEQFLAHGDTRLRLLGSGDPRR